MIECANIYPGPNLKMRRGRRPARGRAVPSRRRREEWNNGRPPDLNWSQEIIRQVAGWQRRWRARRHGSPIPIASTGPASRAQAQVQCPARYVVVRPPCVEGGSPGARGHTPHFPAPSMRGPRATRRARAALASPCPSVASAVALATARARLLLALCLPTCLPVSS